MELWSPNHVKTLLPSFIIMIILGIILRIFLGKKSEKIRMIPFQICTVILLVLEVIKQVKSFADGYDLYHIPLHFCSLFLYLLPAMLILTAYVGLISLCCFGVNKIKSFIRKNDN